MPMITNPDLTPDDVDELALRASKQLDIGHGGTLALSQLLGVSQQTVRDWRNGTFTPNELHTARMVSELGLPERFGGSDYSTLIMDRPTATLGWVFIGEHDEVVSEIVRISSEAET